MVYIGNIFRPPAEHNSILLQATIGCSHNKCNFCGLYKNKQFSIKEESLIYQDIIYASQHFRDKKRMFLCDGDAMIIPFERLLKILKNINEKLPWITRIGLYANAKSLKKRSVDELKELKKHKLGIVYMGLESGDDKVLKDMNKGVDVATQIEQGQKVKNAGMKLSCTVLLGLGGKSRTREHAIKTGKALSEISPNYIGALSLIVTPEAPLYTRIINKEFKVLTPIEILKELKLMIENIDISSGIFSANHASNYLPLQIRLPSEKNDALKLLDKAIKGKISLKSEYMRAI
jgi:radical SAM superfamily enzyme YgiQ (UPF0313 family)